MWYRAFIRERKPEEKVKTEGFHTSFDEEWKVRKIWLRHKGMN